MKTRIKTAIVALTTLLSLSAVAQVPDTTNVIKETQIVRDTVVQTKIVHDTVVKQNYDEPKKEKPPLRHGEIGVRYMPTFSSMSLRTYNGEVIQGDVTMSHGVGAMLGVNFSKNIGLQAEVNYLEITQKYKDRNLDRQVNVSYLNVPVLLSLNTDKSRIVNLNFVAGPQFGFNIGSSVKGYDYGETETVRATFGASGTDIGLAYGTGLEIALNRMHTVRLDLGYRGFYGLVDGNADQTSDNPDTFNVYVKGSRKTHAAYLGLTACF